MWVAALAAACSPAPPAPSAADFPDPFTGSAACRDCHVEIHDRWRENPCTSCHTEETDAWAAEALRAWPPVSPWRVAP